MRQGDGSNVRQGDGSVRQGDGSNVSRKAYESELLLFKTNI